MNRIDTERAEEIVYLWLSFVDKNEKHDGIAAAGMSLDFNGDAPTCRSGRETVSMRAERQQSVEIYHEERLAHDCIVSLPIASRLLVATWPQLKKQLHPKTGELHTETDMLWYLELYGVNVDGMDSYYQRREMAITELLNVAARLGLKVAA
jgi:hypothetical protein